MPHSEVARDLAYCRRYLSTPYESRRHETRSLQSGIPSRIMSDVPTPYSSYVESHDPVEMLRVSLDDYRHLASRLTADLWARPIAPGKWTVRQVVVHVAQWEMIWAVRLRSALGVDSYVIQPIEQDDLMFEAEAVDGPTALATFDAVRRMNLALAASLTPVTRGRAVRHAELGTIRIEDMLVTTAGHGIHHLRQLQTLAGG
jgi:hypothetical protein